MTIEKYVMADLRNWTKVKCLNKTFYERYLREVAKIEWALWFEGVKDSFITLNIIDSHIWFQS